MLLTKGDNDINSKLIIAHYLIAPLHFAPHDDNLCNQGLISLEIAIAHTTCGVQRYVIGKI